MNGVKDQEDLTKVIKERLNSGGQESKQENRRGWRRAGVETRQGGAGINKEENIGGWRRRRIKGGNVSDKGKRGAGVERGG